MAQQGSLLKAVLIVFLFFSSFAEGRSIDAASEGDDDFTLAIKDPDGKVLHEKKMPKVPDGYKLQLLSPQLLGFTGIMPEEWYYNRSTSEDATINFLTKEDMNANNGSYETGMRVGQYFSIKDNFEMTASEFVASHVSEIKNIALEEINEGYEYQSDSYNSYVQEVIGSTPASPDVKYHMVHKYNWSDEVDWAMVIIYGAPEAEWESAKKIFDTMAAYEKRVNELNGLPSSAPVSEGE